MKFVNPSYEIINEENPLKKIEICGRVSYKSEDRITDNSAYKFVKNLMNRNPKHESVIEHDADLLFEINESLYDELFFCIPTYKPNYLAITDFIVNNKKRFLVSGNARSFRSLMKDIIRENKLSYTINEFFIFVKSNREILFDDFEFNNEFDNVYDESIEISLIIDKSCLTLQEKLFHCYETVRFITNRGISLEDARMRRNVSKTQESTRYCNYARKGDKHMQYIYPEYILNHISDDDSDNLTEMLEKQEEFYNYLVNYYNIPPQYARDFLNIDLKTEYINTTNLFQWCHIFRLRSSINKRAHPEYRRLMDLLLEELKKKYPIILGKFLYDENRSFD